ncbi:MAG TPA: hypothetical protein VHZ28_00500 [Terracidiphilus sp.]|nr:hypothetical protein [Terracidiphilus sp.]
MSLSLLSFLPSVDRSWKNMRTECSLSTCHHTQLMRSIPGGKQGISVGERWYCCVDCFAMASREPLAILSARRAMEIPRNPRLSLGLALHLKGYLTNEQLRTASAESQRNEEDFALTVARLGFATEQQITAARASQWGYPMLGHQDYIGQNLRTDIPRSVLETCMAAPLHYSPAAKRIVLGFVYRVEHSVLEAIEQMTGCRVEPCFMTPTDYATQMNSIGASTDYEEVVVNETGQLEKMGRTLGRAAVDVGAREARFARYKNLVWARLVGKRGTADVIFRANRLFAEFRPEKSEIFEEVIAVAG